jgi:ubiquinone/menaquinone biosynthesis C-methylase UbiE
MSTSAVNDNSSIYYKKQYWNDIPQVYRYMCKNFTNDEKVWWVEDFKNRYAIKPFKNALFINCGNGRMEREFIDKKIVKKATAFDYSQNLLDKAEKLKGKRNITYFKADANKIVLKKNNYDLIVNVAGLHHVQYINRFILELARSLTKKGIMVNFDYVGPHRNQYSPKHWKLIKRINDSLHPMLRHPKLLYPSIPVMLREDPTEAIHSELIMGTIASYFDFVEKYGTGGGLAYLLFTQNTNIFKNLKSKFVKKEIDRLLNLDRKLTLNATLPNLFSYFIVTPNLNNIYNKNYCGIQLKKEKEREQISSYLNIYRIQDFFGLIFFGFKQLLKIYCLNYLVNAYYRNYKK